MQVSGTLPKVIAAWLSLAVIYGCYEDPPISPRLSPCVSPEQWIGKTCNEICMGQERGGCHEGTGESDCRNVTVVGYKRQDACWAEDEIHNVALSQGCDDPLPETLTDSVYFIKCCC